MGFDTLSPLASSERLRNRECRSVGEEPLRGARLTLAVEVPSVSLSIFCFCSLSLPAFGLAF